MNIVGHEELRKKLRNLITQEKVSHAYLFYGKAGIGKKLSAIEFAKNIMCLNNKEGFACGECESCKTFQNNGDFYIIEPEKNTIKVDEIRNLINEIYLKPTKGKKKCFIINDADLMNESAQNALLKVLEEPPKYASIILISENKEKLLGTIKSRIIEIKFNSLSEEEIRKILGEEFDKEIINYSRGSVKKALTLSDDGYINIAEEIRKSFLEGNFLKINKKFEEIKSDKNLKQNIKNILETVMLVCYKNLKDNIEKYTHFITIINETNKNIERNANVDLALDNMILKICF